MTRTLARALGVAGGLAVAWSCTPAQVRYQAVSAPSEALASLEAKDNIYDDGARAEYEEADLVILDAQVAALGSDPDASGARPLLHAAGHDHSLQVIRLEDPGQPAYQLVSGAGSRSTNSRRIEGTRYATNGYGYMRIDFGPSAALLTVYARPREGGCGAVGLCVYVVGEGRGGVPRSAARGGRELRHLTVHSCRSAPPGDPREWSSAGTRAQPKCPAKHPISEKNCD